MIDRKFRLGIFTFSYAGNGGWAATHPDVMKWLVKTVIACKDDPNLDGQSVYEDLVDTPITMSRNRAVEIAQRNQCDLVLMVDSDMAPDLYVETDKRARPFWPTAFEFFRKHYDKGPCVIGAPYCGPPPHPTLGGSENVYVFQWRNIETGTENDDWSLEQFSREEAAKRAGFEDVAALPTGLVLFDMRAFDLIDKPYFYYEYEGAGEECPHCHQRARGPESRKCSTEDVTVTRDISMNCLIKNGYNPLYVAWDSWAGHHKPKCVGKPRFFTADRVSRKLVNAVNRNHRENDRLVMVDHERFAPNANGR
jgi:hypothetical protein